jgi:hypothetical protein
MDNFVPIDTPPAPAPLVREPAPVAHPESTFDPSKSTEILAERGREVVIEGFDGHQTRALDTMRELHPPREAPKHPENRQIPPEIPPKGAPVEEKKPLILGKYKSQEELESAYKALEKRLSDPERTRKSREREQRLQEENDLLRRENEIRSKTKDFNPEAPSDLRFNESISQDPAVAIKAEFDRRDLARDLQEQDRLKVRREDELKQSIVSNVNYLETTYPEFQENRKAFADWLTDLGADTNAICRDRDRVERTYGEFIASQKSLVDFANEQREAGAVEALEKHGQVPPANRNELPPPPNQRGPRSDSGFRPIGGPEVPPDLTGQNRTIDDPLEAMELHLGIGRKRAEMF